jgi:hypothetical protein
MKELNAQEPFDETTLSSLGESAWLLKTSIIENYCICPSRGLDLFGTKVLQ